MKYIFMLLVVISALLVFIVLKKTDKVQPLAVSQCECREKFKTGKYMWLKRREARTIYVMNVQGDSMCSFSDTVIPIR